MIPIKLAQFLKRHKLYYQVVCHPAAYTSCETAEAGHICGNKVVKVVMAKVKEKTVMLVLPSTSTVDLLKLKVALRKDDVRIEEETEFEGLFPDCEAGAMPPLGALYHIPCYVDQSIAKEPQIFFNGGNHRESVQVYTADFLSTVKGKLYDFAVNGKRIHTCPCLTE